LTLLVGTHSDEPRRRIFYRILSGIDLSA